MIRPFTCEGRCESHVGIVKRVQVYHGSKDWGHWNYCYNAISEDKKRGMTIIYGNTYCSQCGEDFGPGEHGYSHCSDHQES